MTKVKAKIFCMLLCVIFVFSGCSTVVENVEATKESSSLSEVSDITQEQNEVNEVTVSDETKELVSDTIDSLDKEEDIATNEVIQSSSEEESNLEVDAVVEQENVSYDGTNTGNGLSLLGDYTGLTYYSQADSRWANKLYTSTGNKSQTMKSSACGPTSAAMVVSSSKGAILPTTMAQLFVDNGYRTANNGTAWAAFPFVADYFDFEEYHTSTSFSTAMSYLKTDKDKDGIADYFVIVSCNSGLWTTGGHYIVLIGYDDGDVIVFDPYLYSGKFNTASRRAAGVVVSGNSAFVSESKFYKYSNAKQYWIFSNDQTGKKSSSSSSSTTNVSYTRYVATQSQNLNVRSGPGTSYKVVGSLTKGSKVTVISTSGSWSKIGANKWVSTSYLSSSPVTTSTSSTASSTNYKTTVGATYKLKSNTALYSKSNLSGTRYDYLANTQIKVMSHASSSVDYIYVEKTGRYAYCPVSAFTNSTTTTKSSTVGKVKTLKSSTTLYSKSNLTGTKYQYKANTTVTVVKNVSHTVDYVKVRATGRYAYVKVSAYK